jgi:hypothetical protein
MINYTYDKEKIDRDRPSAQRGRVTVVSQVYCQQPDLDALGMDYRWNRWVDADEEAYTRVIRNITPEPQVVDWGWLSDIGVSMFVIENIGPRKLAHIPDPSEIVPDDQLTILVSVGDDETAWQIRLGEHHRFSPHFDPIQRPVWIRCLAGTTRANLVAVPK